MHKQHSNVISPYFPWSVNYYYLGTLFTFITLTPKIFYNVTKGQAQGKLLHLRKEVQDVDGGNKKCV